MAGYAKLFTRILDSTIWRERDTTRILWITMLALADRDGIVHCTIPGLADRARISLEECEYAINRFQQPDKYSWSQEDGGRRIRVVDDGWYLINHSKFRSLMSAEEVREKTRLRVQKHRERNAKPLLSVTRVTSNASNDIAAASATTTAKANTNPPNPPSDDLDNQILEIAKLHPKILDPFHLSHELSTAIVEAVVRDGRDLVWAGTKSMAEAVAKWPKSEMRFVPSPPRFFRESQYKTDPMGWERNNKNGKTRREQQFDEAFQRAREDDTTADGVPKLSRGANS